MKHTKKIIALALLAVSLFAVALPAMAADPGTITGDDVALRQSPNTTSAVLARLYRGYSVSVLSKTQIYDSVSKNYFYNVTYNGITGYVAVQYVSIQSPSSHPQTKDQAFGTADLRQNSSYSVYVKNVQYCLYLSGYLSSMSQVDGYFGSNTKTALDQWQLANGWSTPAGYVGTQTKDLMWQQFSTQLKNNGFM